MTEILYNWINKEVKLSKEITNICEDFSNGYFFGELLYKYKLLPQFNEFKNSQEKSSITKNYLLLKYKLDELKINFSENDKKDIINKKKYKAVMILFRIREKLLSKLLQIELIEQGIKAQKEMTKIYNNVTRVRLKSANPSEKNRKLEIKNIKENKEIKTSKEKINLNKNIISKKDRIKSAKLPKLGENVINFGKNKTYVSGLESIVGNNNITKKENKLFKETLKEIEIYENIHMKNKLNIEKLEKNKHSKETKKEKNNLESWKKNYKKLKQFDEEQKAINNHKINRLKSATQKSFNKTQQNLVEHTNNFDKKLDELGINVGVDLFDNKKNSISSEAYMKSIIEAVKEKEKMKKQYEIRMKRLNKEKNMENILENNKEENQKYGEENKINFLEEYKKRPQSSATTFMFYSNKNKESDTNNKINLPSFNNRPFTAKADIFNNEKIINKTKINNKNSRPKSSFINNQINEKTFNGSKALSQISEKGFLINVNEKQNLENSITKDVFDENAFFDNLDKENLGLFTLKAEKRHQEIICNRKIVKETVDYLLDIVDLCYDYKNEHNTKLVETEEWNKIINNFLSGNPIIIKKEKPKPKIEEDLDNSSYNLYSSINIKDLQDFGQYEMDELKNYLYLIGDKYDQKKNNLFVTKCKLGQEKFDINNIMNPEEIQILYEEAKKAGRITFDEEDEKAEYSGQIIKYISSKEEEELLEPIKDKYPSNYIFTNLITETVKFSYDKDPKNFKPKDNFNSKVIEEEILIPQQTETEGSAKKNIIGEEKIEISKISDENKNENENKTNSEEDKNINMKELIECIPIRISFLGVQKTEKKTRAKNLQKKYEGLKVYNIKEFKQLLAGNNKDVNDENIIDLLIQKLKEDFHHKNIEDIKKDIIKKREDLKNLNNEIEKLKEDQEKKVKSNIAKEIQNLQQQIDNIIIESIKGFILIGIPENLFQLKLLEKKLMNFIQPCEKNIDKYDSIYSKLTLLCDHPQKEISIEKNFDLSLNTIIHFESNKDVIFQKIDNRKKDPIKGDIYNMNLFPPKDRNVLARLEDITKPSHEEIEEEIINDDKNYELIEDYYTSLDVKCVKFKGYIINQNLNEITNYKNYLQILEHNSLELDTNIDNEIKEALKIYEDKIIGPINENVALLEEMGMENLNINDSSNIGVIKEKKESDLSQIPENNNTNNKNSRNKNTQQQISKKDSLNSSMTFVKDISRINSNNNINTTQGDISSSQNNVFPPASLSEVELFNTYHIWDKFVYSYMNQFFKIFNKEKKSGKKYIQRLTDIQEEFIKFISMPSKKKVIINQFLNKYIEFFKQCKLIENNNIVRDKYLSDVNELNETLWKIVEIKKNESLEKINSLSKIIDQELKVCYSTIEKFAILETQKFIEIINILLRFLSKNKTFLLNSSNTQYYAFVLENPAKEILRKCEDCELATYNPKKNKYNYPKANQIYKNCLRILIKLHNYLNKNVLKLHEKVISTHQINSRSSKKHKFKKGNKRFSKQSTLKSNVMSNSKFNEIQNKLKLAIKAEIEKYKFIIYNLYMNSLESLSKIYCASKLVFKLMDNWIIDSLMYQNDAMNELFQRIKKINIEQILENYEVLSEQNIYKNIELDDFHERYKLFNYNEFLFDGQNNTKAFLTAKELNKKEFKINIEKILKFFTNYGSNNNNENNIFNDIIFGIKNNEIQNGIITKNSFEKIFFINKIIESNNINQLPDFFYNFDFHNISLFLEHFIFLSSESSSEKINENNKDKNENIEPKKDNGNDKIENNKDDIIINQAEEYQTLIHSNEILTILFLICCEVVEDYEIEIIKENNQSKLINGKYMSKEDFFNIEFSFLEKIKEVYKNDDELIFKFKSFLFEINRNKNNYIHFIHFTDLISLKSLKFKDTEDKNKIKYYFDLFYN